MVYASLITSLLVIPDLMAIALIVVFDETEIGELYKVDDPVGVEPLVVYLIDAPAVVVERVIFCADEYVPPAGETVGVAALDRFIIYDSVIISLSARSYLVAIALSVCEVDIAIRGLQDG